MSDPTSPPRRYPYEVINGHIKIAPSRLFETLTGPKWKNAKMSDMMKEYMRRAAEECGEDEAEVFQLDSTKPLQLRFDMPGTSPEKMQAVLEKLQSMGINAEVCKVPATVQDIRHVCDQIYSSAEKLSDASATGDGDALGSVLDQLMKIRDSMLKEQSDE